MVIIGDKKIIVNVINGIGTGTIALDAGKYTANIEYTNKNYENNIKSIPFNVAKANITLSVEVLDKVYTEDVGGNIFANVDGDYIVVIKDNSKLVSVKNGVGEFNFGILNVHHRMSLPVCIMVICLYICLISCLAISSFRAENKLSSLQCLM